MKKLLEVFSDYSDKAILYLPKYLIAILVVLLLLYLLRSIRIKLSKILLSKAEDALLVNFLDSLFRIINIIIGFSLFLYITDNSTIAKGILGAAGISAFVIGFAFKDIGENFLAGVILAFNRPFRLGDVIKSADVEGSILEVSLRDTHIKTFDGKDVYIPNGQILKNPLYNYTIDGFLRKQFQIGVAYDSNIDDVRRYIIEILNDIPGILTNTKKPLTSISEIGDSSVIITAHYWINTFDKNNSSVEIHTTAITRVLKKLNEHKVEIPGTVIAMKTV